MAIIKYSESGNVVTTLDFDATNFRGVEGSSLMGSILESNAAKEYGKYLVGDYLILLHSSTHTFRAFISTGDSPSTPVANDAWICVEDGTYTNFGSTAATQGQVITYNGTTYSAESGDGRLSSLESDKANLASPTFTGTVTLPKTTKIQDTSADHTYDLAVSELTANRIITLPLLTGNDEFVFKDHTQTLTNKTLTAPQLSQIELGHASDTTLTRTSAGVIAVEGKEVTTNIDTQTLTNKRLTSPKLNEDVVLTATATQLNAVTGNISTLDTRVTALERPYQIYGIHYDRSTDTITRLADAIGKSYTYSTVGGTKTVVSDFDGIAPFDWKRCNVADDGTVNAYFGDVGYIEDGSNGQVMVEIPKLYYWSAKDSVNDTYVWYVCKEQAPGFSVHPAFIRDGVEVDYIYFGAYEAGVYDTSALAYGGEGVVYDYVNDLLASVAGVQPISGAVNHLDIVEARDLAQNRGGNWNQQDFLASSLVQMMFAIEFASFNWQSETAGLGAGITNLDSGTGNHSQNTGHTTGLGNSSGNVLIASASLENGATGPDTHAVSYRGIENFFGNIWNFVDGLNVNSNLAYYADHGFVSDTATGYTEIGTLANTNGYISDIFFDTSFNFGFLPSSVSGGSSSDYFCDYYYQTTGWRVALFGGIWDFGVAAGGFLWSLTASSGSSLRFLGARLFSWS